MKKEYVLVIILLVLQTVSIGCNSFANTESVLLKETALTQQYVLMDTPEKAPMLDATLMEGNSLEQHIQAIQLTTRWDYYYEDGTGVVYHADSAHPLQIRMVDFDVATFDIGVADGEIVLQFCDNYPPQSISAQRWNVMYATDRQDISDIINNGEPVDIENNIILVISDGYDYIYEIHAEWSNGSSYYTFLTLSSASTE